MRRPSEDQAVQRRAERRRLGMPAFAALLPGLLPALWLCIAHLSAPALILAVATAASSADAALLEQYTPVEQSTEIKLDLYITNNDSGTIYDSGVLSLDGLAGKVADAVIANNPSYSGKTRNDVMGEWNPNVRSPPTGEVYDGWAKLLQGDNNLAIGYGSAGNDTWYATQQNSNQDMMALTIGIPKSQLDFNQNGQFDAETESIYKTTETVPNAFTATTTQGTPYSAPGIAYDVIPEPATVGLTILGMAALYARRFRAKQGLKI